MHPLAEKVLQQFTSSFQSKPRLFFSPGRINMIGEHIDYNDGYVMPAAIDKGTWFAMQSNGTDAINFVAADIDGCYTVKLDEVKKQDGWKNYVLGVVNEFIIGGKNIGGFDCVFSGDVPLGSGLSSSAALECGLAYGLNEIFNAGLERKEIALLGQRAEHNFPGMQCGIMDQYASVMGKKDSVILLDCKEVTHRYLPLHPKGYKLFLINSHVHHELVNGEYNDRRRRCEEGMKLITEALGITSFRDVKDVAQLDVVKDKMNPEVYDACKFVVEEIARTQHGAAFLESNDLVAFGKLMLETHEGLSKLYDVSCREMDWLVEQVSAYEEVIGARMMGGGFGGCTINIAKEEKADEIIATVTTAYKKQFGIDASVYNVNIGDGSREVAFTL